MVYNSVSCEIIIHKLYNELNVDYGDWIYRAIEWCYNALRNLNIYTTLVNCTEVVKIDNYRGKLPCDVKVLEGIEYQGYALAPHHQIGKYYIPNLKLNVHPKETYEVDSLGMIVTTFEKGEIIVHFKKLPSTYSKLLGTEVPLIPDNEQLHVALKWYCFTMLLARGYKHPVFSYKDAEERWIYESRKVRNSINRLSRDERELHKQLWASMLVNYNAWFNAHIHTKK